MMKTLILTLVLGPAVLAQMVTVSGHVEGCKGAYMSASLQADGAGWVTVYNLSDSGDFLFNVPDGYPVKIQVGNCSVSPKSYTVELNGGNVDGLNFRAFTMAPRVGRVGVLRF